MSLADIFRDAAHIDVRDLLQLASLALQDIAFGIQEFDSQGACEAHAAVVGGGSADGDGNICVAGVDSSQDKFAGAVGSGVQGIALLFRNHGKTGGLSHLEHSLSVAQNPVIGAGHFHQGTVYVRIDLFALCRQDNSVGSPLSAVRHGNAISLTGTEHFMRGLCQKLDSFLARKSSLERI